jgi:flap endonuclease-1
MDSLAFKAAYLLRSFSNKKTPVQEICHADLLTLLDLSHDQFVDLCILCGCDYTTTITRVGPNTAYKLIKQHDTIEGVIEFIAAKK